MIGSCAVLHGSSACRDERHQQGEPAALSTLALAQACRQELSTYVAASGCIPECERGVYGYELFRRAIEGRDDLAWECVYACYSSLVRSWVRRKMRASRLLQWEGEDVLVNSVFSKFAQAMMAESVCLCSSLAAYLRYLKLCVMSVTADTIRALRPRQYEATLEAIEEEPATNDLAEGVVEALAVQRMWRLVQGELRNDKERLAISLSYGYGMQPREICHSYPEEFPSTEAVHRVKRNVLERLQRNTQFKRQLDEELIGAA